MNISKKKIEEAVDNLLSESAECEKCSAKLTGEEGMEICQSCQDGNTEDKKDGSEPHGSLIVNK
jgi:hypothetical protein